MGALVTLAIAGVVTIWIFGLPQFGGESLVYTGLCSKDVANADDCPKWIQLDGEPTAYEIGPDGRTVIMQRGKNLLPIGLQECAVRDRKNWICIRPPITNGYNLYEGILQGNYFAFAYHRDYGRPEEIPQDHTCTICAMPRWKWNYLRYVEKVPVA